MAPVVAFAMAFGKIFSSMFEIELHKVEEIVAQCFTIATVEGFYPSFIVFYGLTRIFSGVG